MRIFAWIVLLGLLIASFAIYLLATFVSKSLADFGQPPPAFTGLFFGRPYLWLFLPVPWLIGAGWLHRQPSPTTAAILVFGSSAFAALAFALSVGLVAGVLPLLRFH